MYYHYHHGTRWQIVQGYLSCGCFPDCWKTALVRELLNRRNLVRLTFIGWLASGHPLVICLSSWMRKAPRNTLDIIQDWSWYSYMKEAGTKDCIINYNPVWQKAPHYQRSVAFMSWKFLFISIDSFTWSFQTQLEVHGFREYGDVSIAAPLTITTSTMLQWRLLSKLPFYIWNSLSKICA